MGENVDLLQNPFHILTATPRDNHARIMDLADERSLLLDAEECMTARLALTTPRKRLVAEVAWLPGIGPKRAEEVLSLLEFRPADILTEDKLLPAARANALAAALSRLSEYSAGNIAKWILELAEAFEEIEPEKLKNLINVLHVSYLLLGLFLYKMLNHLGLIFLLILGLIYLLLVLSILNLLLMSSYFSFIFLLFYCEIISLY